MMSLGYARSGTRRNVDMLCELIRSDVDTPVNHRMTNLSAHGAWLKTSFPMQVGAIVVLAFTAPGASELIVFAEVTRDRQRRTTTSKRGMAVRFIGLTCSERLDLLLSLRHVQDQAAEHCDRTAMSFGLAA